MIQVNISLGRELDVSSIDLARHSIKQDMLREVMIMRKMAWKDKALKL